MSLVLSLRANLIVTRKLHNSMRFSVFSSFAAFGLASAVDYCTPEEFNDLQNAIESTMSTISPATYQTLEAYMEASLAAIRQALGGEAASAEYPCLDCFSTYQTGVFSCMSNLQDCDQAQIMQLASDFSICATGTDLTDLLDSTTEAWTSTTTKDASVAAPALVTGFVAAAALLRL